MKIDYGISNYCTKCDLKFVKQVMLCPECGQRARTKPYYSSKMAGTRRIHNSKLASAKRM